MCPENSYVEILTLKGKNIRRLVYLGVMRSWKWPFMNEICVLISEVSGRVPLLFYCVMTELPVIIYKLESGLSSNTECARVLIFSRTVWNTFRCISTQLRIFCYRACHFLITGTKYLIPMTWKRRGLCWLRVQSMASRLQGRDSMVEGWGRKERAEGGASKETCPMRLAMPSVTQSTSSDKTPPLTSNTFGSESHW